MSDFLMAWLSAHRFARAALAFVILGSITAVTFAAGYQNSASLLGDGSAYLQKEHSVVHVNGATGDVDAQSAKALATGTQRLEVVQVRPGVVYVVNNETGEVYALPTDTMQPEQIDKRPESSGRLQLETGGDNSYLVDAERGTASKLDGTSGPGSDVPIPARIDQLVVDGNGIGWAFAPESGELFQLNGGQVVGRQRVAGLGERVALSLVGNRPLLYRPATGQAALYGSDGLVRRFDLAAEGGIVAESSNADTVVVFVPRTGELVVADVDGDIRRTVLSDRRGEQNRFGRPIIFHGRAYLPDYTFHHVIVVDLAAPKVLSAEPVPGRSPSFDVFVRDNLLWVSDPYDKTVITFDKSGLRSEGGTRNPPSRPPSLPPSAPPAPAPTAVPASPTPPATMRVPNVVGDDRTRACQKLRPLRCHLVAVPEGDGQTGIVLSTDPPAGSRVRVDSRVTVFYRGPAEVPNVVGLTATEACEAIRRAKLTCVERREGTARTAPEAFVLTAQQPPPGTRVNTGTEVAVTYPVNVLVPNVTGAAVAQACAALESATHGFRCVGRDLGSAAGTGHAPGVVIAQRPGANAAAPRGSDVQVDYYGNANTTVPAVVGASPDAACAALAAAHLGCTRSDYVATNQLGVVLAQSHAAGAVVPAGTAVTVAYETTGAVGIQRWKAPAPRRANYIAAVGTGQGPPAGWSGQASSPIGVYLPGTADLPGLWPIYRSRCVSGCGEIGGYYLSANTNVQQGYVMEHEAFRCFDPNQAPAGTRDLHALFLAQANAWVWAVPGTGEWDAFHQVAIQYDFVVCRVW